MSSSTGIRYGPDSPGMRGLSGVIRAYAVISGRSTRPRPPATPVRREIAMRVHASRLVAQDACRLELVATEARLLPAWDPGAHVDLLLPGGHLRQYSLCGDPADRSRYVITVRRIADGGGGSIAAHALRPGDTVTLRGPRNAFPYLRVPRYLFVAGGIGITPIRPMIVDAHRRGADWVLVYTGRSRAGMPFVDELVALGGDRVHVRPDDEFGTPDAAAVLGLAPDGCAVYACGPPPMIDALRARLPHERVTTLHHERFSAPPVIGGEPFTVRLARSGGEVAVAADRSALAAILEQRPDTAYSCRQGFCGTCVVRVHAGAVEHHDRCLTPEQRADRMALCVSRATGTVTIDL